MKLEDLFVKEVLKWRCFGALSAVLAVQAVLPSMFLAAFRTTVVHQVWNPISLLQQLVSSTISFSWLYSLLWPVFCYTVLTRLHVHNYTVSGEHSVRVWHVVRSCVRLRVLCVTAAVCACVCALTQHYAALANSDFDSVVRPCYTRSGSSNLCINTRTLAALSLGLYCGVCRGLQYTTRGGRLVTAATTTVPKGRALRALLRPRSLLGRGLDALWGEQGAFRTVAGVTIGYALLGGIAEQWVASMLGSAVDNNNPPSLQGPVLPVTPALPAGANLTDEAHGLWATAVTWQRWEVLTDPMLLVVLLLSLLVLTVMLQIFHEIFALFVMQPISLPVCPPMDSSPESGEAQWVLSKGLQSSHATLQLLSFQCLARQGCAGGLDGRKGREPVFAISHPGGHPRNWNAILVPTIAIIRNFTEKLKKQNCPEEYQQSKGTKVGNTSLLGATALNSSLLGSTVRNISYMTANTTRVEEKPVSTLVASLRKNALEKLREKLSIGRRLPVVRHLLAELPDAANRQIFAEAQPVVWAVQGLCGLVTASFAEDQFGVVQRNISEVLTALLKLNLVLDKLGRPPLPKRVSSVHSSVGLVADSAPQDVKLRRAAKLALRTALYRLTHTFGPAILEVPLAPNLKTKLQSYLSLMEG